MTQSLMGTWAYQVWFWILLWWLLWAAIYGKKQLYESKKNYTANLVSTDNKTILDI